MADHLRLLLLAGIFFAALLAHVVGRRTALPRVTLVVLVGVVVGPSGAGLVDPFGTEWFEVISAAALTMIGFLLGGNLTRAQLRQHGADVMVISVAVVFGTALVVGVVTYLVSHDVVLSLLLAALSTATDPAATADVVAEQGKDTAFSQTLTGVVAVDDAWGIVVFSLVAAVAAVLAGGAATGELLAGAKELFGAIALGLAIGFPAAALTGRVEPGDPTLAEALGIVFLCLGAALWLDVSFLLTAVVVGVVVANFAPHHDRPFHEIEHIEWPFMAIFFVLAGASLRLETLAPVAGIGAAYVVARIVGRMVAGYGGASLRGMAGPARRWMGPALLPQAGVAIGLALVAAERFPDVSEEIIAIILASTVLFEVAGPIVTRVALKRT